MGKEILFTLVAYIDSIKEVIEWDKLFFNLGIINREDEVPQLIHKENFEGQQSFYFRLPYGIHFDSISKISREIEYATHSTVSLRYENFRLIVDLIDG